MTMKQFDFTTLKYGTLIEDDDGWFLRVDHNSVEEFGVYCYYVNVAIQRIFVPYTDIRHVFKEV